MQDLLNFLYTLCGIICDFLLTEPIYYFTGVLILLFIGSLVNRLIR